MDPELVTSLGVDIVLLNLYWWAKFGELKKGAEKEVTSIVMGGVHWGVDLLDYGRT